MKRLGGNRGIALIMALILSLVGLALSAAVVYMVSQGTKVSGIGRRYATALGAAKGGAAVARSIIDLVGEDPDGAGTFVVIPCQPRLDFKILNKTADWTAAPTCGVDHDMQVNGLGPDDQLFTVTMTIVDTIAGNTPPTGNPNLRVTGVVNTGGAISNPSRFPYMYRIDVHSERPNPVDPADPLDMSDVTVLYAH